MLNKGQKQSKIKKVDMGVVRLLLIWRNKRKEQLAATKHTCTLRPKKNSGPCISCGYYEKCHHYRWEREFIHKHQEAHKASKIRKKKQGDKYQDMIELNCLEEEYPCYPMNFACPDKETCEMGQFCPWED